MENRQREEQFGKEEGDKFMDVLNSGFLPTYDQLYEHQKEGIVFLYEAYQSEKNGVILGDEMGLGKTIQIIVFLGGMLDMGKIKSVLLVLPKSLLQNWIEELKKWTPLIQLSEFDVKNRDTVKNIQQKGGVLLITYKNLIKGQKILSSYKEKHFTWDCVIFDEAHFIRNRSSKCFKAACLIPAKIRLLLSGIPVHKNLQEMWSLFHLACQGGLLGTYATFKKQFEQPILKGMEKTSSGKHKALGLKRAEMLMKVIEPYYFRRTKEEIQRKWQVSDQESYPLLDAVKMAHFTRKNDYVVWVYLSPIQETLYKTLLSMRTLRDSLDSNYNDLITLKKICDHPRLLSHTECRDLEWEDDGELDLSALQVTLEIRERLFPQLSSESLLEESGKLAFLVPLLERLRDEGNRTLVFSRSLKMLDIIEYILKERGFNILRLDGTNCKTYKIQERVTLFQTKKDCSVFLLTCQVGGVGLNLTAANRVVIVDPSWNPATDDQAVARVDRIGQEKDMVIYRLITCGTVEEKIYRWQVFKNTLIKQTTGDDTNPIRYFSNQEIYELFTLENTQSSSTQLQLQNFHHHRRVIDKALDDHLAYLYSLKMFGISEHDLINSTALDRDFAKDTPCNRIHLQVQKNEQRIQAESHMGFKVGHKESKEKRRPHQRTPGLPQKYKRVVSSDVCHRRQKKRKRRQFYDFSDSSSNSTDNEVSWHTHKPQKHFDVGVPDSSGLESEEELHSPDKPNFSTGHKWNTKFSAKDQNDTSFPLFAECNLFGNGPNIAKKSKRRRSLADPISYIKSMHMSYSKTAPTFILLSTPHLKWDSREDNEKDLAGTDKNILESNSVAPHIQNEITAEINDASMPSAGSGHQIPLQLPVLCAYSDISSDSSDSSSPLTDGDKMWSSVGLKVTFPHQNSNDGVQAEMIASSCADKSFLPENVIENNEESLAVSGKFNVSGRLDVRLKEVQQFNISGNVTMNEDKGHTTFIPPAAELSDDVFIKILQDLVPDTDHGFSSFDDLICNLSTLLPTSENQQNDSSNNLSGSASVPSESIGEEAQKSSECQADEDCNESSSHLSHTFQCPGQGDVLQGTVYAGIGSMAFESPTVSNKSWIAVEDNGQKTENSDDKEEPFIISPRQTADDTATTKAANNHNNKTPFTRSLIGHDFPGQRQKKRSSNQISDRRSVGSQNEEQKALRRQIEKLEKEGKLYEVVKLLKKAINI